MLTQGTNVHFMNDGYQQIYPLLPWRQQHQEDQQNRDEKIPLRSIPNGGYNKVYLQGLYLYAETYQATIDICERCEIAKIFFKGSLGKPSKNIDVNSNHMDTRINNKGGESASPSNPKKVRSINNNT